jgi:hypothetical protein
MFRSANHHSSKKASQRKLVFMRKMTLAVWAALVVQLAQPQPIRLHPDNPHYFLFRGRATPLITSGEHYGSVINADFDYRRYLATIERDGLNLTRLFGGSYVEVPGKSFGILRNTLAPVAGQFVAPWARSSMPGYAGGGNKFDLERWNPEYFRRYRDFLDQANQHGMVVEVTLFSSQYGDAQWAVSPFHPANNINHINSIDWKKLHTLENGNILALQERYVRKLVREANDFDNVIFEIQNEPWSDRGELADVVNPYLPAPARDLYPNSVDVADSLSIAWQTRVAEWIASEEHDMMKHHLIAQNYSNFRFSVRELIPQASIVNFHYAYPDAAVWNYGLGKAIAYDETGFLGRNDDVYRRQAWNFMLAGGSTFDALDYSFSPGHEDGSDSQPNGPGGGSPALRKQLRVLREFLESFDLAQLRPDFETVKHAGGAQSHVLSDRRGAYAIYLDGHGPSSISLLLPAGDYAGEWVDPATGSTERVRFSHRGGEWQLVSPHYQNGIALRLKRNSG